MLEQSVSIVTHIGGFLMVGGWLMLMSWSAITFFNTVELSKEERKKYREHIKSGKEKKSLRYLRKSGFAVFVSGICVYVISFLI